MTIRYASGMLTQIALSLIYLFSSIVFELLARTTKKVDWIE